MRCPAVLCTWWRHVRCDLLFNNAGANCAAAPVEDTSPADWRSVLDINLTGAFLAARGALRMMRDQVSPPMPCHAMTCYTMLCYRMPCRAMTVRCDQVPQGGRIINNGSVSADRPRPGSAAYTASKHGLTGLTKAIALDGRAINVACGQIDYGNVESSMTAKMATGVAQADGSVRVEPRMHVGDAANAVHCMAALPLSANVLNVTVMATAMPLVGRG